MLIAEPLEALERKGVVRAFRFLETQNIGPRALDEFGDKIDAQADRVDVPGGDGEGHDCPGARAGSAPPVLDTEISRRNKRSWMALGRNGNLGERHGRAVA